MCRLPARSTRDRFSPAHHFFTSANPAAMPEPISRERNFEDCPTVEHVKNMKTLMFIDISNNENGQNEVIVPGDWCVFLLLERRMYLYLETDLAYSIFVCNIDTPYIDGPPEHGDDYWKLRVRSIHRDVEGRKWILGTWFYCGKEAATLKLSPVYVL